MEILELVLLGFLTSASLCPLGGLPPTSAPGETKERTNLELYGKATGMALSAHERTFERTFLQQTLVITTEV